MATIRDVAKEAGVSPITVSRVMNGAPYVSEAIRKRVERAIKRMNYVPNALARSLRSRQTQVISLIITDVTNPFWTTVARGVEDMAERNGFSLILCNTDEDMEREKKYISVLLRHRVAGVIVAPASKDVDHLRLLRYQDVPFVVIDRRVEGLKVDTVRGDSVDGAYQLTLHLLSLGHRRIAMICGPSHMSTAEDRLQGYLKALREYGLSPEDERIRSLVRRGEHRQEDGYRLAKDLLQLDPRPTAIFAVNNVVAVGALRALREAGLRVPEDVALVGYDDIPHASLLNPFLTVAAQPAYEMGAMAVQILLERLTSGRKRKPVREIIMKPSLIIRKSCGSECAPSKVIIDDPLPNFSEKRD